MGKGLATEAAAAVLKYGREELNLERIVATVFPETVGSVKVLEKLGLSLQGKAWLGVADEDLLLYS